MKWILKKMWVITNMANSGDHMPQLNYVNFRSTPKTKLCIMREMSSQIDMDDLDKVHIFKLTTESQYSTAIFKDFNALLGYNNNFF